MVEQLAWTTIQQRFSEKNALVSKTFFDLNVTTKNGFGKTKYQLVVAPPIPPRSDLQRAKAKPIYYNEIPRTSDLRRALRVSSRL